MSHEFEIYRNIGSEPGEFGPESLRRELTKADGGPVTIRLNSEGGNVIDGLACYNLLKAYRGRKTVHIDGMALSVASTIVMAADEIVMPDNAWLMVHNPHNVVAGDGDDLRGAAGLLDSMADQLADIYATRSRKPVAEIKRLMTEETWMTGPQALEAGFVDEVTASLEVAAVFDASRFRNVPIHARAASTTDRPARPESFHDEIVRHQKKGESLAEATRSAAIGRPDLREDFVEKSNEKRDLELEVSKADARRRRNLNR